MDSPSPPEVEEPPAPLQATSREPAAAAVTATWIILRVRMTDSRGCFGRAEPDPLTYGGAEIGELTAARPG
ncbi:hypothetical protein Stsp02_27570 [Streptomyces sp. NBRC 14336]|nr:hypothetical protein Stsp02_27570 [Streptomyces sp. NBRC 14336]